MKPFNFITCIICAILFALPLTGFSQSNNAKITGTVKDETGKPVEFATVSLLRLKDSVLVKGTLTNNNGLYVFERVAPGVYIVKATMVGYNKGISKQASVIAEGNTIINVADVIIKTQSKALGAVTVQSTRPLFERKLDRTVMNVENSVLAAGNSAMEILERAPGVTIDKDDNISLNGKSGVTVMINDKLTYLSAAQLATYLRSTDGSNIATIEIITNPSAKYDAAGNSGILNIKLKKNSQAGTSGSLTAGAGYGAYGKDNESLTINHKQGRLNAFATLSHNDNKRMGDLRINRVVDSVGKQTYFTQRTQVIDRTHNSSFRLGADYDLNNRHTIGFIANGYYNMNPQSLPSSTFIGKAPGLADTILYSTSDLNQTNKNFAANVNDRLQLDTAGQTLGIDLDYSWFDNTTDAHYGTFTYLPNGLPKKAPVFLQNQTPATINIRTAKADYVYPFSKGVKLEAGVKFSNVKTDNNLLAQKQDAAGNFINDTSRTNHFIYQEKIDAGYISLGKTYKTTSLLAGLRTEYTSSVGDLINSGQMVPRHYLDFFPSLFINHTFSKKSQLGFSYSRRIDRPSYDNLNPFVYYLDQYTYNQGNPFLKPQYTHSLELNYTYNHTINFNLNYSHTSDVITQIILTDPIKKASYQTNLNLQTLNAYGLNVSSPFTLRTWWTGNLNVNSFYLSNKSAGLLGANLNTGRFSYNIKLSQTFTLVKGYRLELYSAYKSSIKSGIYDIRPQYNVDAGINHPFAKGKANIKLSVNDIFNTLTNNVNSVYQSVNLQILQKRETRITRLTLTYNFGNNKIKARQHQTGADDEKNRAGGQ